MSEFKRVDQLSDEVKAKFSYILDVYAQSAQMAADFNQAVEDLLDLSAENPTSEFSDEPSAP